MCAAREEAVLAHRVQCARIFSQPLVVKEANFTKDDFIPILHWANDPTVFAVKADSS